MDDKLKITKLISRAIDDTRTVIETNEATADDLNSILEHTTNEVLIARRKYDFVSVNDDMPPRSVKIIVQHETSNGKDHAFGVYHKDVDKWFYFNGSWDEEDSIEVTHWMHDLPIV